MNDTRTVVRGGFYMQVGLALIIFGVASATVTHAQSSDLTGPRLVRAVIDNAASGGPSFGSNTINVLFSEPVDFNRLRDTNNFKLTRIGDTNCIPILSALYSTALGLLLNVDAAHPDWVAQGDYVLTVNRLRDTRGNVIAPDSQIAVSRRSAGGLLTPSLPTTPPPMLFVTQIDAESVRFSWTGHGYALESATELTVNAASYPLGPWQEVPNMANPYTNSLAGPQRFFRLKK
jgi:hypothetical protein